MWISTTFPSSTRSRPVKKSPSRKTRKSTAAKANRPRRATPSRPARVTARKTSAKPASRKRAGKPAPGRVKPATNRGKPAVRPAKSSAARPVKPPPPPPPPAPTIRKGLPVSKVSLRRPGRPFQMGPRPVIKSIIVYTTGQKPRNEYPKRIVSPPFPSACCTDAHRERIGKIHEELGRNYYYKRCRVCGHTVKYYFNVQSDLDSPKFRKYYEWKKSVFH